MISLIISSTTDPCTLSILIPLTYIRISSAIFTSLFLLLKSKNRILCYRFGTSVSLSLHFPIVYISCCVTYKLALTNFNKNKVDPTCMICGRYRTFCIKLLLARKCKKTNNSRDNERII
jgi:hypothetical protein